MTSDSSFETIDAPMDTVPDLPTRFTSSFPPYEPVSFSSSTSAQDDAVTKRDSDFYMESDMLTFVVEKCLYKVPRFFLNRETAYFTKMYSSQGLLKPSIVLNGVSTIEFKTLLHFLIVKKYDSADLSLDQWILLLSISTHFEMASVREHAITELSTLRQSIDAVDQVVLALKHDIPEWITVAYTAICEREKPLTSCEAAKLGGEIPFMIAEAREATIRAQLVKPCPECPPKPKNLASAARRAVDDVFGREAREKEKEKLAMEEEMAKQEAERIRTEKEQKEQEKNRKLKEAKETKEKAERLIKEMEEEKAKLEKHELGTAPAPTAPVEVASKASAGIFGFGAAPLSQPDVPKTKKTAIRR